MCYIGTETPFPKRGWSPFPILGPFLSWPNGWTHGDATWYGCRPQPRGLCVRWRPSPPPKKGAEPPNFWPMFIVAKWLDGSLGTKVGLNPGDCVLDGDPASPLPKGHSLQIFGPYLLQPNGCMDQVVTRYGASPQPRRLCVRWRPSPPPKKGAEPPNFRPMFIVSCRTRVKRIYACGQIHYWCFSNYRIRIKYSAESRDVADVICAKIDCNKLMFKVTVTVTSFKHRSLSQKRLKPSLCNSNVHFCRKRNLDTEPSASKILRDKDSAYCFIYV